MLCEVAVVDISIKCYNCWWKLITSIFPHIVMLTRPWMSGTHVNVSIFAGDFLIKWMMQNTDWKGIG